MKFRFARKEDGCWEWIGSKTTLGYGQLKHDGKKWYAHRLMWIADNGDIPVGAHVLHSCDNPSCINPEHLRIGTHSDNMRDKYKRGGAFTRISQEDAIRIREAVLFGASQKDLAAIYGAHYMTINRVVNRKRKAEQWL